MTPTPPSYSSQHPTHSNLRLSRNRRPRNANPYDASHNATTPPQIPVTPLVDDSVDHGEIEDEDIDIDDVDGSMEHDGEAEFGNEDHEGEEEDDEEGGIEEGHRPFWLRPFPTNSDVENRNAWIQGVLNYAYRFNPAVPMEVDDATFDAAALGMKEIGNLASWTVSSCKPGCGVEALRDDDTNLFWQSDGPQPHHLNIHFSRLVSILSIRIFLDFRADESYTPTRITLLAGTGYHDLIPFSSLEFEKPVGWIDVPLDHVGGGEDGKTLRAFLVQVKIVENHQNGKDTHVRGLKVYARDERVRGNISMMTDNEGRTSKSVVVKGEAPSTERVWLVEPEWMVDPELR